MRSVSLIMATVSMLAALPVSAQVTVDGPGEPGRRAEGIERADTAGQVPPARAGVVRGRDAGWGEARRRDQWRERTGERNAALRGGGVDRNDDGRPDRYYDRNRDGRLDRNWDRNRDGALDRRWDRNRDDDLDRRWDRNGDDRIDRRFDRNRDGRVDSRGARPGGWHGYQGWNHDWRRDRRYDWYAYRDRHRHHYRAPRYVHPYGYGYGYRRYSIGFRLDSIFLGSRYWISDPWRYRLPPPRYGLRWIRYFSDVLLVDVRNGYVVDVIHDFFW